MSIDINSKITMERKANHLQELSTELSSVNVEIEHVEEQIGALLERQQILLDRKRAIEKDMKEFEMQCSGTMTANGIDWSSRSFSWTEKIENCLHEVFKLKEFRKLQREAINVTMSGIDCIMLMPTGAGKSLCFQLPAVLSNGITLVISPLLSLIEDQLISLMGNDIKATFLNASSTKEEVNNVHYQMTEKNPMLKLLYVTPEKVAKSKRFMAKLEKCYQAGNLSRVVIDEVHCTSQWGHDFRPDYKILGIMKKQFPKVPILGLTATATTNVIEDVKKMLGLERGCLVLRSTFNRGNLFYEVRLSPSSEKEHLDAIASIIDNEYKDQAGIVYCFSRKDTEQVTRELKSRGIKAACYHADIDYSLKTRNHRDWVSRKVQVIVATVAFGMGIDKPDVRFVIHFSISKSIQNYYQESGRAGRDDNPARCILFFKFTDVFRQSAMVFTEQTGTANLHGMLRYCLDLKACRRTSIGRYFGEVWDRECCNQMCDNCQNPENAYTTKDITKYSEELITIINQAARIKERLTPLKLVDAWLGKGPTSLRLSSVESPNLDKESCQRIIVKFVVEKILQEDMHFTPYSTICYLIQGPRYELARQGKISITIDVLNKHATYEKLPKKISNLKKRQQDAPDTVKPKKLKTLAEYNQTEAKIFTKDVILID